MVCEGRDSCVRSHLCLCILQSRYIINQLQHPPRKPPRRRERGKMQGKTTMLSSHDGLTWVYFFQRERASRARASDLRFLFLATFALSSSLPPIFNRDAQSIIMIYQLAPPADTPSGGRRLKAGRMPAPLLELMRVFPPLPSIHCSSPSIFLVGLLYKRCENEKCIVVDPMKTSGWEIKWNQRRITRWSTSWCGKSDELLIDQLYVRDSYLLKIVGCSMGIELRAVFSPRLVSLMYE